MVSAISVWEMKAKMIGPLRSQGVLYRFWYNTLFFLQTAHLANLQSER